MMRVRLLFGGTVVAYGSISHPPSDDALDVHGGSGRTLLQMKKGCNISFENLDYSVLTDKCKGPQYPAKPCCDAFKEFACPFSDAINDLESDCAATMFSFINLYGKYPPGLFANECREDKNGLDCQNVEQSKKSGGVKIAATQSSLLMLAAGLMAVLLQLF
ncbi:GPI-ANCHORED PROTEIN LLG1-RELATED-RELATED [Salix purpurea]|uniref:GPI-ANCHORED PROTEIN LLG1-RELATED-RELATED n=1 Tax=Salix purpurea TaxID=77065 RepID=A0A9Q1AAE4_SALPP|nr:GPI-ANCHORED PROTEIN LLG1-RELATED-RELATED [Salix purpurea]